MDAKQRVAGGGGFSSRYSYFSPWSLLHTLGGHFIATVDRIQDFDLVPRIKIVNRHLLS